MLIIFCKQDRLTACFIVQLIFPTENRPTLLHSPSSFIQRMKGNPKFTLVFGQLLFARRLASLLVFFGAVSSTASDNGRVKLMSCLRVLPLFCWWPGATHTLTKGCLPGTQHHSEEMRKYRQGAATTTHCYCAIQDDCQGLLPYITLYIIDSKYRKVLHMIPLSSSECCWTFFSTRIWFWPLASCPSFVYALFSWPTEWALCSPDLTFVKKNNQKSQKGPLSLFTISGLHDSLALQGCYTSRIHYFSVESTFHISWLCS